MFCVGSVFRLTLEIFVWNLSSPNKFWELSKKQTPYNYAVFQKPDSAHIALFSEKKFSPSHALRRRGYKIYLLVSLLPPFIRTLVVQFTKKRDRLAHGSALSRKPYLPHRCLFSLLGEQQDSVCLPQNMIYYRYGCDSKYLERRTCFENNKKQGYKIMAGSAQFEPLSDT